MPQKLKLALLGPPQVWLDDKPVTLSRNSKTQGLLYFLAVTNQTWPRPSLAELLWGDMADEAARVNLSKALTEMRQLLGDLVIVDRQQVGLNASGAIWSDVAVLAAAPVMPRSAAEYTQLAEAVELVRGQFLQGFSVRNASAFEQWLLVEQERLQQRVLEALDALAAHALRQGRWNEGIAYARRALTHDSLYEPGHRTLMALLAGSGQRAAALQQYESLRQLLDTELAVEPSPETQQVLAQIQTGQPAQAPLRSEAAGASNPGATVGRHSLPRPATPFIGRTKELADIRRILTDPECRLLTLVGAGGMGKTRLALQVAQELIDSGYAAREFADGVYFVPLAPATDLNGLAATIAQVILTDLFGSGLSPQQLIDLVAEKRMLLALDNFEHLRDAAPLLADLLVHAPGVRLLVTSREALGLAEAWLYSVGGLPVTQEEQNDQPEAEQEGDPPDALRLFVASARRKQPSFSLARQLAEVTQICRLVGGMPLAIELAAAWLNVMPLEAIVADLQKGLDLLTSRNTVIPRHRSIRVVLEESWRLLAADEAAVFDRLAVFRGGFRPEAGMAVTGASAATLAGLVDRALIQLDGRGRFQIHELLHQFAAEKLAQAEEARTATHALHSRFYLDLLNRQYQALNSPDSLAAIESVRADFENIVAAWQWALGCADYEALDQVVVTLFEFCTIQGRLEDGVVLLEQLAGALAGGEYLERHRPVYGRALACLGELLMHLDRGDEGLAHARRSLEFMETELDRAFALGQLGWVENVVGRPVDAQDLLGESVALYRKLGRPVGLSSVLIRWAMARTIQEGWRVGQQVGREAVLVSRRTDRLDRLAEALSSLGFIDCCCGDYDDAIVHMREALAIAEELGHRGMIMSATDNIAWSYVCKGEAGHPDVLPYLQRAIAIGLDMGNRTLAGAVMAEYALALSELGQIDQAVIVGREAVTIAQKAGIRTFVGLAFAHFGGILTAAGLYTEAHQVLRASLAATFPVRQDNIILNALYYLGELLLAENRQSDPPLCDARLREAATLLTLVARHHATWHYFKVKASQLLATLAPCYLPDDGDGALSIDEVVPALLNAS
jgi:predicted ATPase/DNA-binding SARP family transcriptional activator